MIFGGGRNMLDALQKINDTVQNTLWGFPLLFVIIFAGIVTTVRTDFFQFRHPLHIAAETVGGIARSLRKRKSGEKSEITQFQALCTALAATIGTGNIAGVAAAICTGGPGAVFWMWVSAIVGMMTNFTENVLGIYYRIKNADGEWCGGAMYYLRGGVGKMRGCRFLGNALAAAFAFFCMTASLGMGNMVQVNTMAQTMKVSFSVPPVFTGCLTAALVALVILRGIKGIGNAAEKLVPFMAIGYTIGALALVFVNRESLGDVFAAIFRGAFGMDAVCGGVFGTFLSKIVSMGFKRGIFSNEAGLGSSVTVHAASDVKEPVVQGMWGIFEVFVDTIVICTLTAAAILSSGVVDLSTGMMSTDVSFEGVDLVTYAFSGVFHKWAGAFISVTLLLFAFATVIGWSYYGVKAAEYLFGDRAVLPYKTVYVILSAVGAVMNVSAVWSISDTLNALMAIPNLIGVILLSGTAAAITRNYAARKFGESRVRPMLSAYDNYGKG